MICSFSTKKNFDFNETFEIYNKCSKALIDDEIKGANLLIHILNFRNKFSNDLDEMLTDLVESIGFYPYIVKENLKISSTSSEIRFNSNISKNIEGKCFHDEQKKIIEILKSGKNLIVSAPTSFDKSLLIEEVVASKKYKNIVVIQPTLALLDETRRKLSKYSSQYKIIVRTSQEPATEKGNLFLLTAERVNEYQNFPNIDFLIIDEFYKLSSRRDDERSDSLNNSFRYILEKYNPQFYLLGPNIEGISEGFAEKYNAQFFKTNFSLVACDEIDVYESYKGLFGERGDKKLYKEKVLFDLLFSLKNQNTIIYCSSPSRARYLSTEYCKYLASNNVEPTNLSLPIIDWIESYVSSSWSFIQNLKYGIGVHDGALQKHISTTVINHFNNSILNTLFCTATIIEGVNTNAKNVIFFDKKKGFNVPIDFFDYSNIKGRAGRLMEHYIGNIYNFNPPPPKDEIFIDIPFFEQSPISDEVLININPEDVLDKDSDQFNYISNIPVSERELFTKNSLYIRGQDSLVNILRGDVEANYHLIAWDSMPTYEQLEYCIGLAWDYLVRPEESFRPMTKKKIVKVTFDYGINKSINKLVESNFSYKKDNNEKDISEQVLLDEAIRDSFQILRHWFQYKIPKWLLVINELQRFVCNEKGLRAGNYLFYASSIECDFIRDNLTILAEYGIPKSAIDKLEKYIPKSLDQEKVLEEIIKKGIYKKSEFLKYEQNKILENYNNNDV
nr:DEAD/DEAH box helicase [Shewanella metallivivens]